jgi:[lysine-biosynthesis-protein LysW]---L-2-aminoadipate ligase
MTTIGILFDRMRWEEKEIARCVEARGESAELIDAKAQVLPLNSSAKISLPETLLVRCVSFYRGLNIASVLESLGRRVINSSRTLELCGNKLETSLLLAREGVPTPKTLVAFSPEGAINAMESLGFPCVLKPLVGSWGRQVVRVRDLEQARDLIEMREALTGDSTQSIFYVQEMIKRPPRDIRCITVGNSIVASVYRIASEDSWKTNVALGGRTEPCPLTKELEKIVLKAAGIVGFGILGVDVMESEDLGYVVHEVNGTVEFRGAQSSTPESIADKMAQHAISESSSGEFVQAIKA